jgi:hypothetical protein
MCQLSQKGIASFCMLWNTISQCEIKDCMIFGHIEHSNFSYFHPVIQSALRYLQQTDLASMPVGQYEVGDQFIVQIIALQIHSAPDKNNASVEHATAVFYE